MEKRRFFSFRYVGSERRRANWVALLFLPAAIFFFLFCGRYLLGTGWVTDVSMTPTLSQGRFLWINKGLYRWRSPARGDLVVFRPPNEPRWLYIKRVVGLPGETISLQAGRLYVNGQPVPEPYAIEEPWLTLPPVSVPVGFVFVLGDNRGQSEDSRHFGPVSIRNLIGKVQPNGRFPLR